jgi:hypothetical protein
MTREETQAKLDSIIPGKNYPNFVEVNETDAEIGKVTVRFMLTAYLSGLYRSVTLHSEKNGDMTTQDLGEHKRLTASLKKDIEAALDRGAEVTIGEVVELSKELPDYKPR